MLETLVLAVCLVVAAAGTVWDVRKRRIPNLLCVGMALVAFCYALVSFGLVQAGSAALHGVAALLVGMLLFRFALIGGGDAKFYAAAAFGVPLNQALLLLGWTSIAGLLLLLVMVAMRMGGMSIGPRDAHGRVLVPYGVAIGLGFALTLLGGPPGDLV